MRKPVSLIKIWEYGKKSFVDGVLHLVKKGWRVVSLQEKDGAVKLEKNTNQYHWDW